MADDVSIGWSNPSCTIVSTGKCVPRIVADDIIIDQGLTPFLARVWMPLVEFTKLTLEGLVRGDPQIAPGMAGQTIEKYHDGIVEAVQQFYDRTASAIPSN